MERYLVQVQPSSCAHASAETTFTATVYRVRGDKLAALYHAVRPERDRAVKAALSGARLYAVDGGHERENKAWPHKATRVRVDVVDVASREEVQGRRAFRANLRGARAFRAGLRAMAIGGSWEPVDGVKVRRGADDAFAVVELDEESSGFEHDAQTASQMAVTLQWTLNGRVSAAEAHAGWSASP